MIDTQKFREIKNKHAKIDGIDGLLFEKLNIVDSDTGSYAYLNECIADGSSANFKGLKESRESGYIEPGENTYTIDYNSALIAFSENFTIPSTLYAEYWGGGSIIWADDVSSLQEACRTIDNNALYKDGSVALTGNLNLNGNNINNVTTLNGVNIRTHKHLGSDVDGTAQLEEESIPALPISKITNLQTSLNSKQDKLPAYQSGKYLTNNGSALSWGSITSRNIGEVVQSILPLNDPKLHLLNGSVLSGTGTYGDLYNYLLNNATTTQYVYGINTVGSLQNENGVLSGFSSSNYAQIPLTFGSVDQADWEVQIKFKYKAPTESVSTSTHYQNLISSESSNAAFSVTIWFNTQLYNSRRTDHFMLSIRYTNSSGNIVTAQRPLIDSESIFQEGQYYWIRYGYTNSSFYVLFSTDGVEFLQLSFTSIRNATFPIYEKSFLNLGIHLNAADVGPWLGSIDLNGCYIDSNGVRLWQGGSTYSRAEASYLVDEGIWQGTKYKYGVCGKFSLDLMNRTAKLPLVNSILQGSVTPDHVGNIVEAGLPNITGRIGGLSYDQQNSKDGMTGAFYWGDTTVNGAGSGSDDRYGYFNASRSNAIYGNSNTVQPQTVKVLNYMVVAK